MIYTLIGLFLLFVVSVWAVYKVLKEMIDYYGPLLWGFWGEIWDSKRLTFLSKLLIISIGFVLYIIIVTLSLYWMKPLFIKG